MARVMALRLSLALTMAMTLTLGVTVALVRCLAVALRMALYILSLVWQCIGGKVPPGGKVPLGQRAISVGIIAIVLLIRNIVGGVAGYVQSCILVAVDAGGRSGGGVAVGCRVL